MSDDKFIVDAEELEIERLAILAKHAEYLADAVNDMKEVMMSFPEVERCVCALRNSQNELKPRLHNLSQNIYAPGPQHLKVANTILSAEKALDNYMQIKSNT